MSERVKAVLWLVLAYACAVAAGASTFAHGLVGDPLWDMVLADVVGTATIFLFSLLFRNSSFYDPYWSFVPLVIAWGWHLTLVSPDNAARSWLIQGLMAVWGLRLTYNFLRGFDNLSHCDWRYRDLETNFPRIFWLVSLSGIHYFPSLLVFLGLMPVYLAMSGGGGSLGLWDGVAAAITLSGALLEGIADQQLVRFVRTNTDPKRYIDTGLWSVSRHPNYMGEVTFWWGLALFGYSVSGDILWSFLGAVCMTALFVFISIPMMEKRTVAKRPGYVEHQKRVSVLVPWPPKRRS